MRVKLCAENGRTAKLHNVIEIRQERDYPDLVIIITNGMPDEIVRYLETMGINSNGKGFCTTKDNVESIEI